MRNAKYYDVILFEVVHNFPYRIKTLTQSRQYFRRSLIIRRIIFHIKCISLSVKWTQSADCESSIRSVAFVLIYNSHFSVLALKSGNGSLMFPFSAADLHKRKIYFWFVCNRSTRRTGKILPISRICYFDYFFFARMNHWKSDFVIGNFL